MHDQHINRTSGTSLVIGLSAALLASAAACGKSSDASQAGDQPPTVATVKEGKAGATEPAPAAKTGPETLRDGEYTRLAAFVGDWSGTGSLKAGGNDMPVASSFHCEVARGGVAITCVHEAQIEGMGSLIENALIGIDPAAGTLHWYNINTMGETHDHVGSWAGDHRIDWRFEGEQEGKPLVELISMEFTDASIAFRSETTVGGEQAALFEGTLSK